MAHGPHRTTSGETVQLGPQLGRGGGGRVYERLPAGHRRQPTEVVKVFDGRTATCEQLLKALVALGPPALPAGVPVTIAWPTDLIYDPSGRFVGYVMPRAPGVNVQKLVAIMLRSERRRLTPNLSWRFLMRVARCVWEAIDALHAHGVVLADINESNVLVSGDGWVTIIDVDSMCITDARGRRLFTAYCKPDYLAPELRRCDLHRIPRTVESDRFGGAVLTFQLLLDGFHPHDGIWASGDAEQADHAEAGRFSYGTPTPSFRPPPGAPPFRAVPPPLAELFCLSFTAGAAKPGQRPDARRYADTLHREAARLVRCKGKIHQHHYSAHLTECPWCEYEARLASRSTNGQWPTKRPTVAEPQRTARQKPAIALAPSPPAVPSGPATASTPPPRRRRLWPRKRTLSAAVGALAVSGVLAFGPGSGSDCPPGTGQVNGAARCP